MLNYFLHDLDAKQAGFLQALFFQNPRWKRTDLEQADFVFTKSRIHWPNKKVVFLDAKDWMSYHWEWESQDFIDFFKQADKEHIFYLKLQVERKEFYRDYQTDKFHVLSCPMLLGGSTRYILEEDLDDTYLFSKNLVKNEHRYRNSICFINGVGELQNRLEIFKILSDFDCGAKFLVDSSRSHANAHEATIPYEEALRQHRQSQINISTNGIGLWCLKDAELFSRNCFIFREHHDNLNLNPLSPIDKKHWIVFKKENLTELLQYYLNHVDECIAIADSGFDYFTAGIQGSWAESYTDSMLGFLATNDKNKLNKFLV